MQGQGQPHVVPPPAELGRERAADIRQAADFYQRSRFRRQKKYFQGVRHPHSLNPFEIQIIPCIIAAPVPILSTRVGKKFNRKNGDCAIS
jgi:hypothetical protein